MKPRRLTKAGVLELAICLAQYCYYELDDPIMSDVAYDELEKRYKTLLVSNKTHAVVKGLMARVGSGDNLREWLERWRDPP